MRGPSYISKEVAKRKWYWTIPDSAERRKTQFFQNYFYQSTLTLIWKPERQHKSNKRSISPVSTGTIILSRLLEFGRPFKL